MQWQTPAAGEWHVRLDIVSVAVHFQRNPTIAII